MCLLWGYCGTVQFVLRDKHVSEQDRLLVLTSVTLHLHLGLILATLRMFISTFRTSYIHE